MTPDKDLTPKELAEPIKWGKGLQSLCTKSVEVTDSVIKDYLTTCYAEYSDSAVNPMPANLRITLDMIIGLMAERNALKASNAELKAEASRWRKKFYNRENDEYGQENYPND